MRSKLNLNQELVQSSREIAREIAADTQKFIDNHSTVAVERTICRLLGIDGVNEMGVPLPNVVVENIEAGNGLGVGAAIYLGNAMLHYDLSMQEIAEKVAAGEMDLTTIPMKDSFEIKLAVDGIARETVKRIAANRAKRDPPFFRRQSP